MNLVNNVKDRWDRHKLKQMKKDVIRVQQEMLVCQDQLETSRTGGTVLKVNKRPLTPAINNELGKTRVKKKGYDKGEGSSYHIEPDNICEKGIAKRICNKKKYRLREGNEREWIEKIKVLMERQHKKPLEQKLAELMPLVRYHQDIKNAIKAKRIAVQQKLNTESVNEFLSRLSELYGRDRNNTFHRKINKKIKCNKCKKRGHLRKNCKENKGKLSKEK